MTRYLVFALIFILFGCTKQDSVNSNDVIANLKISNRAPLADGTTIIYVTAQLNAKADADKKSIIFITSAGQFISGTTPATDSLITQPATFQNGILTATVGIKMPATAGKVIITAKPVPTSQVKDFILKDSVIAGLSVPHSIVITPSASSVKADFGSEVQITALLRNDFNNNVSTGRKVLFQDYNIDGTPLGGKFRAVRDTTDATSTVTAAYSQGALVDGGRFYIICTYVDPTGTLTQVKDTCFLNVIKN